MSFPIRCFSCNKVIGFYEQKYKKMLEDGIDPEKALNTINMTRYCCRRMFLSHVDITDKLLLYTKHEDRSSRKKFKTADE